MLRRCLVYSARLKGAVLCGGERLKGAVLWGGEGSASASRLNGAVLCGGEASASRLARVSMLGVGGGERESGSKSAGEG